MIPSFFFSGRSSSSGANADINQEFDVERVEMFQLKHGSSRFSEGRDSINGGSARGLGAAEDDGGRGSEEVDGAAIGEDEPMRGPRLQRLPSNRTLQLRETQRWEEAGHLQVETMRQESALAASIRQKLARSSLVDWLDDNGLQASVSEDQSWMTLAPTYEGLASPNKIRKSQVKDQEQGCEPPHPGDVYYFGIIDFYTRYNVTKMAERRLKAATGKELAGISAAPTEVYARRFLRFIETNTCGAEPKVPLDYHLSHALSAAGPPSTEVARDEGGLCG